MKKTIEFLKGIAEVSIKITAVVTLIIGTLEVKNQLEIHQNEKQIQREEKVMQLFIKQYEQGLNLSEMVSKLYRDFDLSPARKILMEKDEALLIKNYEKFIIEFTTIDNKDRYKNLLILTDFYNGLASCVESELCDKEIAKKLFQVEGQKFFQTYYPFFCYLNNKWKDQLIQQDSGKFYGFDYEESCSHSDKLASF